MRIEYKFGFIFRMVVFLVIELIIVFDIVIVIV